METPCLFFINDTAKEAESTDKKEAKRKKKK
jgi:hypothetical protein